jgi:hypothetical protein
LSRIVLQGVRQLILLMAYFIVQSNDVDENDRNLAVNSGQLCMYRTANAKNG